MEGSSYSGWDSSDWTSGWWSDGECASGYYSLDTYGLLEGEDVDCEGVETDWWEDNDGGLGLCFG